MNQDYSQKALLLERVLRQCGEMLIALSAEERASGVWEGEQFKAVADQRAHQFLVRELSTAFPNVPIISEEELEAPCLSQNDDYIIIDPIDGTASFAQGFAGWVTQAAYIKKIPLISGIYAPISDEYFSAIQGRGAFCNGSKLILAESTERPFSIIDNYPQPRGIALAAKNALSIPVYLESGSIALKICRVADNSADLFLKDMHPRDWDIAAPMLLLEEAGGKITDIHGDRLWLGSNDRRHHGLIAAKSATIVDHVLTWLGSKNNLLSVSS